MRVSVILRKGGPCWQSVVRGCRPQPSSCVRLSGFELGKPHPGPPSLDLTHSVLCLQVYASSRPLRVGYYETDNYTMPTPAMKRAVLETKQRLEAAGHTVRLQGPRSPDMAFLQAAFLATTPGHHPFLASLHPDCLAVGTGN